MSGLAAPDAVLSFWRAAGPDKWFTKDAAFDAEITTRFADTYAAATAGQLGHWTASAAGALALVIVLDQFARNIFRGDARTYAADPLARAAAEEAISRRFDREFALPDRQFFYMPFMHAEDLADQERCVALFREAGDPDGVKHAEEHADIIRRFGRFPHRNAVLGRATTPDEQAFLDGGGFAG